MQNNMVCQLPKAGVLEPKRVKIGSKITGNIKMSVFSRFKVRTRAIRQKMAKELCGN